MESDNVLCKDLDMLHRSRPYTVYVNAMHGNAYDVYIRMYLWSMEQGAWST